MDYPSPDSEELALPENKEFIAYLTREIDGFLKANGNSNTIMLFPPFNSYKRLLLHHLVELNYNNCGLSTFSIGQEPRRRTVVCLGSLRKNVLDDDANDSKTHRNRSRISDERRNVQDVDATTRNRPRITFSDKTSGKTSPKPAEDPDKPPERPRKARKTINYYVPPHLRKNSLELEPAFKKEKKGEAEDSNAKTTENDSKLSEMSLESAKAPRLSTAEKVISYYVPPPLRKAGWESEPVSKMEKKGDDDDNKVTTVETVESSVDVSRGEASPDLSTSVTSAPPELTTKVDGSAQIVSPALKIVECEGSPDWDPLYCGKGTCSVPNLVIPILDDSEMSDICKEVGKVQIVEVVGPTREEESESEYVNGSMVEIYDLDDVKTDDLVEIFGDFVNRGFRLRWIDPAHALGIFSSSRTAEEALASQFSRVKIRPISQGTSLSQEIARNVVLPSSFRPKTCSSLAKRLLSGALGLKVSPEERAAQRERLKEVKDLRRKLTPL